MPLVRSGSSLMIFGATPGRTLVRRRFFIGNAKLTSPLYGQNKSVERAKYGYTLVR
jgi:hypothetical protein